MCIKIKTMRNLNQHLLLLLFVFVCTSACKKSDDTIPSSGTNGQAGGSTNTGALPTIGVPVLAAPFNGATGIWAPVGFMWNAVSGATSYDIEAFYDLSKGYALIISNTKNTTISTGSFAQPSDGWKGRVIYWHVKAKTSKGSGAWSNYNYFTLKN
jgi:hypothetical protein